MASPNFTPRDLTIAVNKDPQLVLSYITSLESENQMLKKQLKGSRHEMFTVVHTSLSAIAAEMTNALNVTKNSLVGVQEKFNRVVALERGRSSSLSRPTVMKHYEDGAENSSSDHAVALASGILRDEKSTTPYHQRHRGFEGMMSPLNPHQSIFSPENLSNSSPMHTPNKVTVSPAAASGHTPNTPAIAPAAPVALTPNKSIIGSAAPFGYTKPQVTTPFMSLSANAGWEYNVAAGIVGQSPVRPGPQAPSVLQQSTLNRVEKASPANGLAIRSDSEQNARSMLDSKALTVSWQEYMSSPDRKRGLYHLTTKAKSELLKVETVHQDGGVKTFVTNNNQARSPGKLIRYDVMFLKTIGNNSKHLPNPFINNRDDELRPVLEWHIRDGRDARDQWHPTHRHPRRQFTSEGGLPDSLTLSERSDAS